MLLAFAGLLAAGQVIEARAVIEVEDNGASVEIDYVFSAPADGLTLHAFQWLGQTISLEDSLRFRVVDLGGSLRIEPSESGVRAIHVAYEVAGSSERIPLFVPSVPTVPGTSRVVISVTGVAQGVSLSDAFPRLSREDDATLLGEPANIPSFVLLPVQGRVSRARLADGLVLCMLFAASVVWTVRRVRSAT